jgi:hypothetical protein
LDIRTSSLLASGLTDVIPRLSASTGFSPWSESYAVIFLVLKLSSDYHHSRVFSLQMAGLS